MPTQHECDWSEYRREFEKAVETLTLQADQIRDLQIETGKIKAVVACLGAITPVVIVVANHFWK